MEIKKKYALKPHNTFGIAVQADWWIEFASVDDLELLVRDEFFQACRLQMIGEGSNLLFLANFNGIVLHSAIQTIEEMERDDEQILLRVGSGLKWDDFVAYAVEQGYYGAENLSYIPGEVGASAVQNIGAYGAEVSELIVAVHAINCRTGQKKVFRPEECNYAYRYSIFKEPDMADWIIYYVDYKLGLKPTYRLNYSGLNAAMEGQELTLSNLRDTVIAIRRSKLPEPSELGNAGSFFMNPTVSKEKVQDLLQQYPDMPHYPKPDGSAKVPAAWMIERCGLKGYRQGDAGVYEKQALVLVNHGEASGEDIAALAKKVAGSVQEKFGVQISPEVKFID